MVLLCGSNRLDINRARRRFHILTVGLNLNPATPFTGSKPSISLCQVDVSVSPVLPNPIDADIGPD